MRREIPVNKILGRVNAQVILSQMVERGELTLGQEERVQMIQQSMVLKSLACDQRLAGYTQSADALNQLANLELSLIK